MHTHQDLFRECPIFHLIPPPTALSLVEHFEPVVFVPDEIVIHEGNPNASLFVINRGLVSVWQRDAAAPDQRKVLTTLTDNDFFGEQTLLQTIQKGPAQKGPAQPVQANATCQALSYCDMFRLSSQDFTAVLEQARSRRGSGVLHELSGVLVDAAVERNTRADRMRKRSLMWAAAHAKLRMKNEAHGRQPPLRSLPIADHPMSPRVGMRGRAKVFDAAMSEYAYANGASSSQCHVGAGAAVRFQDSHATPTSATSSSSQEEEAERGAASKGSLLDAARHCVAGLAPAAVPAPAPDAPNSSLDA